MANNIHLVPSTGENLDKIQYNSKWWHKTKLKGSKPKDLAELIFRMVTMREETIFVDKDGNVRNKQCGQGRSRSVEDIFRVAKFYNPNITLKQVNNGVIKLYGKNLSYHFCNTVKRYVHTAMYLKNKTEDIRKNIGNFNINF